MLKVHDSTPDSKCEKSLKGYARVWLCKWNEKGGYERVERQPRGIISFEDNKYPIWIEIESRWIKLHHYFDGKSFVDLNIISRDEYETDLAFELFKELRITSRPIRRWFTENCRRLTPISFIICFSSFVMSEKIGDVFSIVGAILFIVTMILIILMPSKLLDRR